MSKVVGREQCDVCQDSSRDNKVIYDDGSTYCFACNDYTRGDEMEPEKKQNIETKSSPLVGNGQCKAIETRGISQRTCEFFNYQIGTYTGYIGKDQVRDEPVHIANYCDSFGTPVAQKLRASKKRMIVRGCMSISIIGQSLSILAKVHELS